MLHPVNSYGWQLRNRKHGFNAGMHFSSYSHLEPLAKSEQPKKTLFPIGQPLEVPFGWPIVY